MKVLVIDNDQDSVKILEQYLTPLGHELHSIDNERDGPCYLADNTIDLVFIDMNSNAEGAVETIKAFRAPERSEWFPVVVLTPNIDDDVYASAILAGADAILPKPLNHNRMLMQVIALERIYLSRQNLQASKDLMAANLALLKLSMYDEVTDLANRRYFEETLGKEFKLAKRHKAHLTVLMCEIDGFKRMHETHGVKVANALIRSLVDAINAIPSRPTDLVCRYGVDLFSVILPATDEAGASHISEKISVSLDSELKKPAFALLSSRFVFSIGSATDDGRYRTMEDLIAAAFQSLQAAKKTNYILRNL
ncbi:MAG: GGDEF domain-containing response regulator [Gammaproteobacteria bacterium]